MLDALVLTRALLHPSDRIAWLAVLHAPWCGLGLADLLALTGEGEDADPGASVAHLVLERRGFVSEEGQRLLDRAWPLLKTVPPLAARRLLLTSNAPGVRWVAMLRCLPIAGTMCNATYRCCAK